MSPITTKAEGLQHVQSLIIQTCRKLADAQIQLIERNAQWTDVDLKCLSQEGLMFQFLTEKLLASPPVLSQIKKAVHEDWDAFAEFLCEKNRRYGNSAITPCRIMSQASPSEQILVRMDDKINRILHLQPDDMEDAVADLRGYYVLYQVSLKLQQEAKS